MTLALARDKLAYTQDQLERLSAQVRVGDLTPVMEMYEDEIRRPLRSALMGSLLRNVFVQVQKAKVSSSLKCAFHAELTNASGRH